MTGPRTVPMRTDTVYYAWTPNSGTLELPRVRRGIPFAEQPTTEIAFPWFRPSVPTRYGREPVWRRVCNSPAADHLRSVAWPVVVVLGLVLALAISWETREFVVTWQGLLPIGVDR